MLDYLLKNIDDELWKDFKAVSALQGKTVRDKLLYYIETQSKMLTTMVLYKDRSKYTVKKGDNNK